MCACTHAWREAAGCVHTYTCACTATMADSPNKEKPKEKGYTQTKGLFHFTNPLPSSLPYSALLSLPSLPSPIFPLFTCAPVFSFATVPHCTLSPSFLARSSKGKAKKKKRAPGSTPTDWVLLLHPGLFESVHTTGRSTHTHPPMRTPKDKSANTARRDDASRFSRS